MTPATLLSNLTTRGVEFQVHGDKLRFRPPERLTPPDLESLRENKAAILQLLRSEGIVFELPLALDTRYPGGVDPAEFEPSPMFPDEADAANEFYWANLTDDDLVYLTGPRVYPSPCPWCGGRQHHHRMCDELRASWEPTLPFGMHKGKPLSAVSREYLEWLVSCGDGVGDDLRDEINIRLGRVPR